MARRGEPKGRGWLSSIDKLPDWAEPAKLWAMAALDARKLEQAAILEEFNRMLREAAAANGVADAPQISAPAFNRAAMRKSITNRNKQDFLDACNALGKSSPEEIDNQTIALIELGRIRMWEAMALAGEGGLSTKELMEASRALTNFVLAQTKSAEHRDAVQKDIDARTVQAIDTVAKAKGLSADTVEDIKARILGMRAA